MPSNYPTSIDSFTNPTGSSSLSSPSHASQHANANDAIEAIQTELGINPRGSRNDVVNRLNTMDVTQVACSDETSALTTGDKVVFRVVGARSLVGVRASLTTAQSSGSILTVDVKKNGTTVLSTLVTIDNGEKTSTTAATPAVISATPGVADFADDDEATVAVPQVGTGGAGLKVSLLWE